MAAWWVTGKGLGAGAEGGVYWCVVLTVHTCICCSRCRAEGEDAGCKLQVLST